MAGNQDASRNLLFGLLALQVGMVEQGQLVAAFQAWTQDRKRSLATHLLARGDLVAEQQAAIDALVELHIKRHAGDLEKSLAAVPAGPSTREQLEALGDARLTTSIGLAGSASVSRDEPAAMRDELDRTATYDVGSATADGQRFRVLRPHARGGLGAVFVAIDSELPREVALKRLLDHHADDPTSRQRFLLEAEITGGLEHPGIVPVYGLGTYGDGRPFYAMRFIRGDSLKEAIDRFHADETLKTDHGARSLALRKLLRRFLDVCNAIDYAHGRGVLHRDIKPGNIIVGKHGETLVVDWGLAKVKGTSERSSASDERLLAPSSASGSAETLPGSALGTPAYMSPEQARGDLDRLGPRSDVYSLGATLYCLLTGSAPYEGELCDVLRAAQRGEFVPLRQRNAGIDRALEAVCLKAMALEGQDRYPSARALADDVERWIADEPVLARREPLATRASRWARRHRTAVAALGLSLATAVVLLTVANVRVRQAQRETARALVRVEQEQNRTVEALQRADANFHQARQAVEDYFTTVSEETLLDEPGMQPLREKLLRSALKYHDEFLKERADDPTAEAELAESHRRYANLAVLTSHEVDPLPHLQEALLRFRKLVQRFPDRPEYRTQVARTLEDLGIVLADKKGLRDEALRAHRESQTLFAQLLEEQPGNPSLRAALASDLCHLGLKVAEKRGGAAEAGQLFRRAREILRQLATQFPDSLSYKHRLADLHNAMYDCFVGDSARQAEAIRSSEEALTVYHELLDRNPNSPRYQMKIGMIHDNRAGLYARKGDYDQAVKEARTARQFLSELVRTNPKATHYQMYIAGTLLRLGQWLGMTGHAEEGIELLRESSKAWEQYLSVNPADRTARGSQNSVLLTLADNLTLLERLEEAEPFFRQAADGAAELVAEDPSNIFHRGNLMACKFNLAMVLSRIGRNHQEAVSLFEVSRVMARELFGAEAWEHGGYMNPAEPELAWAYSLREVGRVDEAEKLVARSRKALGKNGPSWFELARYEARGAERLAASGADARAQEEARIRATNTLRHALDLGFSSPASVRRIGRLAGLDQRPDFPLLLLDAAFPAKPFGSVE